MCVTAHSHLSPGHNHVCLKKYFVKKLRGIVGHAMKGQEHQIGPPPCGQHDVNNLKTLFDPKWHIHSESKFESHLL